MNALKTLGSWRIEMEYSRTLRRLIVVQVMWIGFVALALQLQNVFTFERWFVIWYVGFITTVHLFAPADPTTRWWRGVQIVAVLGFLGLCYFVLARAGEVLSF